MVESRSILLLLATLAATVTYQAGLSLPGGVWPHNNDQDIQITSPAGNPILLDIHPKRYKAFYYCNTAAFVASLVVIVIVQSNELSSGTTIRQVTLKTAIILGLYGLMGAQVAGSSPDAPTTIYIFALAVTVLVYSITNVLSSRLIARVKLMFNRHAELLHLSNGRRPDGSVAEDGKTGDQLESKRQFLLQIAILGATITYQTGLNPPGGFWPESKAEGSLITGDPVLLDHYQRIRYQMFFYCNATGFMASIATIFLLVNQKLNKQGFRSNALQFSVWVGLLGPVGAYAAGSCRQLHTSIFVFALVAAVVVFLFMQILLIVLDVIFIISSFRCTTMIKGE
ncbi:unnamed protein product [Triticum turgidum subsp. durum]|uniref:PGG domain-containing protein n=1 Tax=Triticum turgidum subsp. durum TaxID=4567 RepID=A0A9R0SPG4_TRITD|nr:unnamed protein product [Triticum turgidum subsp. durum]